MRPWSAAAVVVAQKTALLVALSLVSGTWAFLVLFNWDAWWYVDIIEHGYSWPGAEAAATGELSNLAFFPVFPFLVKALATVIWPPVAAFGVVWVAAVVACLGIYRLGRTLAGPAVGALLVVLWDIAPRSVVALMPYSESLFTAFVAWTLWALVRDFDEDQPRWWWLAGVLCGLAGATRPSAVPLIATLWLVWVVDVWRHRRWSGHRLASAALGTAGFVGYWIYVAWRVGDPLGYLVVQRAWGSTLTTPVHMLVRLLGLGADPLSFTIIPLCVMVGYTALLVWLIRCRYPWPVVVFAAISMLLVWSQDGYLHSKARFLLPVFVLWLPMAHWLADKPRWLKAGLIATGAVGSVVLDTMLAFSSLAP